ncbi:hypothetical protein EIN_419100 [Entamoeba invadens IP1]|uniref:TLDc domain-containing protein n=1 Tax=Entamoeba invadens IP1 TaxID=370355 RepID=A0A0A1U1U7_ENTIV|nr:hypothetical protein EIN_419100 [Entamoeba invadens IP1]ELP87991.1 hypothetical protein EIN_419100 [Entamoeba invadens IP1]|eukprot:XP_004254762.1 hypothetical protein EIN_419100 [Entamoeba invadens IP1]
MSLSEPDNIEMLLDKIVDLCTDTRRRYQVYKANKTDVRFTRNPNETLDAQLIEAQKKYTALEKNINNFQLSKESLKMLSTLLKNVQTKLDKEIGQNATVEEENNLLLKSILQLEEEKFRLRKNEIQSLMHISEPKTTKYNATEQEVSEIEQWTGLAMGDIVFDSDTNRWDKFNCDLYNLTRNRNRLCFLVEDTQNNKFGAMCYCQIGTESQWAVDRECFAFTLTHNGSEQRQMYRVTLQYQNYGVVCYADNNAVLFSVCGGAFWIGKKNAAVRGECNNGRLMGAPDFVFTGLKNFTPKKVLIVQMV